MYWGLFSANCSKNTSDDIIYLPDRNEEKNGDNYSMTVGLYRLTTLSEGTVIASNDGVVFDSFDANGEPMKVSFKKDSSESFTLKIEESTWPLLESSTVVEGMARH